MTVSISGSFSASSSNTVAPSAPSTPPAAEVENKATAGSADTVKLSQAAQVHLLKQQGQGLSQIATNLGISLANVDSCCEGSIGAQFDSRTSVIPKQLDQDDPDTSEGVIGPGLVVDTGLIPDLGICRRLV